MDVEVETLEKSPRPPWKTAAIGIAIGVALAIGATAATLAFLGLQESHASESGLELISADDNMTDEEIRAKLDERVKASMMDVYIGSEFRLIGNELFLDFANTADNSYMQRISISQDDQEVYRSDPIKPGYSLKSVTLSKEQAAKIHEGGAQVSIYAIDEDGVAFGNGAVANVQISEDR